MAQSPRTVRITLVTGAREHDLDMSIEGPATVATLVERLRHDRAEPDAGWSDGVTVDGTWYSADTELGRIPFANGSRVTPRVVSREPRHATAELVGLVGQDCGVHHRLSAGTYRLGSEGQIPVAVAEPVALTVTEHGQVLIDPPHETAVLVNGRRLTGPAVLTTKDVFQVGDTVWRLGRPGPDPAGHTPIVFNRPPRVLPATQTTTVTVPERPSDSGLKATFRWAVLAMPLILGPIMVFVIGNWRFIFMVLMSPVMATFGYLDNRRKGKKTRRKQAQEFAEAMERFRRDLASWRALTARQLTAGQPDQPAVVRRALRASGKLWERRPHHDDFLALHPGYGRVRVPPPIGNPRTIDDEVQAVLDGIEPFEGVPITVGVTVGEVIGIAGPMDPTRALARTLVVQAATHHGPADLRIAVVAAASTASSWAWTAWLPHIESAGGRRMLAATPEDREIVFGEMRRSDTHTLLVVDGEVGPELNTAIADLLGQEGIQASAVVLATTAQQLPSVTTTVITSSGGHGLSIARPSEGQLAASVSAVLTPESVAADVARSLARVSDPEVGEAGAALPDAVGLLEALWMSDVTGERIVTEWQKSGRTIKAPIGVTTEGLLEIDLVKDGPHALLAGTTGAGKSELLRTLVASLAAKVDPDHLTFVLIDYKGGSAFDACAALPHVVGMVTDLDAHLSTRALTCLEAELHHRERVLRDAGASDLPAYLDLDLDVPLPRLFIVIDEFAAMAKDMPDFMDALVDIAARGRSLGVHIMLATQRPAGVIKDNIRANTNLRLSLRVQDVADSRDVLDDPAAASLPRATPGRGYARFGPSELVAFQTALVTGASGAAEPAVHLDAVRFGPDAPAPPRASLPEGVSTDLERLVAAINDAALLAEISAPRTPWPPALPENLRLHEFVERHDAGPTVPLGLLDAPEEQTQRDYAWNPAESHLLLYGLPNPGPAEAAKVAVASVTATRPSGTAQVYVLGFGTHDFSPLDPLPHVAGVVGADDRERQTRVLRTFQKELQRRRANPGAASPAMFLVLDDYAAFKTAFEGYRDKPFLDTVEQLVAQGAAVGLHAIITAYQLLALPMRVSGIIPHKLLFEFADTGDYTGFGFKKDEVPNMSHGRCLDPRTKHVVQIALDGTGVSPIRTSSDDQVPTIAVLPTEVSRNRVQEVASCRNYPWYLPVGIGDVELAPVGFTLNEGEHACILGPARCGKSSTLLALATMLAAAAPDVQLVAITPRKSWLSESDVFRFVITDMDEVPALTSAMLDAEETIVTFVDDAELTDPNALTALISARRPNLHVIAAGRSDDLARAFTHWTARIRKERRGLIIQPEENTAGEALGTKLPHFEGPLPVGRAFLIGDGQTELTQLAR